MFAKLLPLFIEFFFSEKFKAVILELLNNFGGDREALITGIVLWERNISVKDAAVVIRKNESRGSRFGMSST